ARPVRHIVRVGPHLIQVLEMAADDASLEDAQTVHRAQVGTDPVAHIGARADTPIAVFDDRQDIVGIPHPVIRVARASGVIVKSDVNVILLYQLLDGINRLNRFGGNTVKAHGFGKLEDDARLGLVFGNLYHAVIDRGDLAFGQLGFDFLDYLRRGVVVPGDTRILFAEFLAGIKLNHLAAGLGGFLDGLEYGKVIERIGLAADGKPAGQAVGGDFVLGARPPRHRKSGGEDDAEGEIPVAQHIAKMLTGSASEYEDHRD